MQVLLLGGTHDGEVVQIPDDRRGVMFPASLEGPLAHERYIETGLLADGLAIFRLDDPLTSAVLGRLISGYALQRRRSQTVGRASVLRCEHEGDWSVVIAGSGGLGIVVASSNEKRIGDVWRDVDPDSPHWSHWSRLREIQVVDDQVGDDEGAGAVSSGEQLPEFPSDCHVLRHHLGDAQSFGVAPQSDPLMSYGLRYHRECEEYDARVCTKKDHCGFGIPASLEESLLVSGNAIAVHGRLVDELITAGLADADNAIKKMGEAIAMANKPFRREWRERNGQSPGDEDADVLHSVRGAT